MQNRWFFGHTYTHINTQIHYNGMIIEDKRVYSDSAFLTENDLEQSSNTGMTGTVTTSKVIISIKKGSNKS